MRFQVGDLVSLVPRRSGDKARTGLIVPTTGQEQHFPPSAVQTRSYYIVEDEIDGPEYCYCVLVDGRVYLRLDGWLEKINTKEKV